MQNEPQDWWEIDQSEGAKAAEEHYNRAGTARRTLVIFGSALVDLYKNAEKSAGMTAKSLGESDNAAARAMSYPMQGIYYALKGTRFVIGGAVDMVFSPNGILIWALVSAVFMGFTTWGPGIGLILFGATAATIGATVLYRGQQLFEIEQVRREHRLLSELTNLEHEFTIRVGVLRQVNPKIDVSELGASAGREWPKPRPHNPAKGLLQGFLNTMPDWAVNVITLVALIMAAASLNPYAIAFAVIATVGDFGMQVNMAVNVDKARNDMVNDIEARKAALGLEYTGHTGQDMAKAITDRRQDFHDKFVKLMQLEKVHQADIKKFHGFVDAIPGYYNHKDQEKNIDIKASIGDFARNQLAICNKTTLSKDNKNFADSFRNLKEMHEARQSILQALDLPHMVQLMADVHLTVSTERRQTSQEAFQALQMCIQVNKVNDGSETFSIAEGQGEAYENARQNLQHAYAKELHIVKSFVKAARAARHMQEAVEVMANGITETRPRARNPKFSMGQAIADIGEQDAMEELMTQAEKDEKKVQAKNERQNQREARYDSIGLYKAADGHVKQPEELAISPVTGLARAGAYFSSLLEVFAAGMSRNTSLKLYNPYNYYSGRSFKAEQVQFLDDKHNIDVFQQDPVGKFTKSVQKGAAQGRSQS